MAVKYYCDVCGEQRVSSNLANVSVKSNKDDGAMHLADVCYICRRKIIRFIRSQPPNEEEKSVAQELQKC